MSAGVSAPLIYLDTVIVIYAVEGPAPFQARAQNQLAHLLATGHRFAVSDLTRLECHIKPLRLADVALLANYDTFLASSDIVHVPITPVVFRRATAIRAHDRYALGDSLHLAAAGESGCAAFLTNDLALSGFTGLPVQVLP